mmetsp:Transcript_3746/g.9723  ORF Transcript_3746/g.9723 Transcript_3746/m.9723 type:complete len:284 (+) Transcript_3746:53-904(+)
MWNTAARSLLAQQYKNVLSGEVLSQWPRVPIWVLLGAPGSGKGTYASLLAPRFGLWHISAGDVVRHTLQWEGHPEHDVMAELVRAGRLVSDGVMLRLLQERLRKPPPNISAVLLDGFPRTESQAHFLLDVCHVPLALRVHIQDRHILTKIAGRRICSSCGRGYNVASVIDPENEVFMPPLLPKNLPTGAFGSVCEHGTSDNVPLRCDCGGSLEVRIDDDVAVATQRLQNFHATAESVDDVFRRRGVLMDYKVRYGVDDMDDLSARIAAWIDERPGRLAPASTL